MIIVNETKEELVFRAHGEVIVLKPGVNTFQTLGLVTPEEIKRHFGHLINIFSKEAILVTEKKQDEEDVSKDDTEDTAGDNSEDGKLPDEQEGASDVDEGAGEENADTEGDASDTAVEGAGKDEAEATGEEGQVEEAEVEDEAEATGEEGQVEEAGEGNAEDIDSLKRPALLQKYKELGIEGSPARLSNDLLKEAIKAKLG